MISGRLCVSTAVAVIVCGWGLSSAESRDLSETELTAALEKISMPAPWAVNQVAYVHDGLHWSVNLFYSPKSIGDICVADIAVADVSINQASNVVVDGGRTFQKVVSLRKCATAKKRSEDFAELDPAVSNEDLQGAAGQLAELLKSAAGSKKIDYEVPSLRRFMGGVRRTNLHWLRKDYAGHLEFGFFVEGLYPEVLAIRLGLTRSEPVYVYRQNGPDMVSEKK